MIWSTDPSNFVPQEEMQIKPRLHLLSLSPCVLHIERHNSREFMKRRTAKLTCGRRAHFLSSPASRVVSKSGSVKHQAEMTQMRVVGLRRNPQHASRSIWFLSAPIPPPNLDKTWKAAPADGGHPSNVECLDGVQHCEAGAWTWLLQRSCSDTSIKPAFTKREGPRRSEEKTWPRPPPFDNLCLAHGSRV